jgi:hypothetical protein
MIGMVILRLKVLPNYGLAIYFIRIVIPFHGFNHYTKRLTID